MIVRLHMSRELVLLDPDQRAREALEVLRDSEVRHAPVVADGKLVGIVTDRDLLKALPGSIAQLEAAGDIDPLVAQVMTPDPLTIDHNARVDEAVRMLLEHRIHGLPVLREGHLVGIVTDTDLFHFLASALMRRAGERLTLYRAPGTQGEAGFDLVRTAVEFGLEVESVLCQDYPGGGEVTELFLTGAPEDVARLLDRAGDAGFARFGIGAAGKKSA